MELNTEGVRACRHAHTQTHLLKHTHTSIVGLSSCEDGSVALAGGMVDIGSPVASMRY